MFGHLGNRFFVFLGARVYPPSQAIAEELITEFESLEVEAACRSCEEDYRDCNADFSSGVYSAFEQPEDLPDEREAKVIFDLAEEFDLEGPQVKKFKYATLWSSTGPYLRFDENRVSHFVMS